MASSCFEVRRRLHVFFQWLRLADDQNLIKIKIPTFECASIVDNGIPIGVLVGTDRDPRQPAITCRCSTNAVVSAFPKLDIGISSRRVDSLLENLHNLWAWELLQVTVRDVLEQGISPLPECDDLCVVAFHL
jgi:hypothetical protein